MGIFIYIVHQLISIVILIIIVQSILTFFMAPYHPVRQTLDRFVGPFLAPIRRFLPPVGGLDFSPLVLIVILEVIDRLLVGLSIR